MAATNSRAGNSILLFWQGLRQVLATGALRGDVLKSSNVAKNGPLKGLVIGSYQALRALQVFGRAVKEAFGLGVKSYRAHFDGTPRQPIKNKAEIHARARRRLWGQSQRLNGNV